MSKLIHLSRRKFIYGSSCACAASLLLPACTEVAMSDRKQFNILSDDFLYSRTFPAYNNFKSQSKLITGTSEYNKIVDIGYNIRDAINAYYQSTNQKNPTTNFQWEFILVDDDQTKNAWCMPGGKIAFYSGILPIAKNTDGIASIMGHEIAHAVARHSAERASTAMLADLGTMALEQLVLGQRLPQAAGYVRQFGLDLPFNRKQESEADYLGLIFSSLAGYDINESYKVWERMKEDIGGSGPSEFFSTHPSPDNRIIKIKQWIPLVNSKYPAISA
tara:strand:- start:98 stop:922 length:825 start_codon:yes stop_codon:yes gene_type:complete